jgi:dihydrofolate reductase
VTLRKLVYYIATSLDGFIAGEGGELDGFPWDEAFGAALFEAFPETFPAHLRPAGSPPQAKRFDTVLMGRKTFEVALREGITNPYPHLRQYLFSRTLDRSPDPEVRLVSDDAAGTVASLKERAGRDLWLCGGAELATTLFRAGLVDELIVKLNPVLFGTGIPLLGAGIDRTQLVPTGSRLFPSGHVLLHYAVPR